MNDKACGMPNKRFNPTCAAVRVWYITSPAGTRGLTWALNLTALWPVSDALVAVGLPWLAQCVVPRVVTVRHAGRGRLRSLAPAIVASRLLDRFGDALRALTVRV